MITGPAFEDSRKLCVCLTRDYAAGLFRLLVNYHDISASEAASRLDIHIRTAQDFLETLASLGILARERAMERKRPYYRYSLATRQIRLEVDLDKQFAARPGGGDLGGEVRERKGHGAHFSTARSGERIASIGVGSGAGRNRRERKISLTAAQGRFLYHLPFPSAAFMSVREIESRAKVGTEHHGEIVDLLDLLDEVGVIERHGRPFA